LKLFLETEKSPKVAIFMSGTGTNAEKVLENRDTEAWQPAVIVTDAPEQSRAAEIAANFSLPLVALDIRKFYREHGETKVSLKTARGREIRELWTTELRRLLSEYQIDFAILAGFVPLTNITADFPCLNVHPGDLTVETADGRLLVGLHAIPVEIAILHGHDALRSSVIIAQAYSGVGGEMDSGPILGISSAVPLDLQGHELNELTIVAEARSKTRPIGGYKDILAEIADHNLDRLKRFGDWTVLPGVVNDFAAGNFAMADDGSLKFCVNGNWQKITTVEYGDDKYLLKH
jgi:folate-dependent phosphoribosylglycinamide formyltransferase PurN